MCRFEAAWLDFVSLHDIDFKQSLQCSCPANNGVPKRIGADGIMLGCQQQKVRNNSMPHMALVLQCCVLSLQTVLHAVQLSDAMGPLTR